MCVGANIDIPTGVVTAPCGTWRRDECCDGFQCKIDGIVSVRTSTSWRDHIITSAPAPYSLLATNNYNQCCLPQAPYDVTGLLCPDPPVGDACPSGGDVLLADSNVLNNLACLCCTGVLGITTGPVTATSTPFVGFCNPPADVIGSFDAVAREMPPSRTCRLRRRIASLIDLPPIRCVGELQSLESNA